MVWTDRRTDRQMAFLLYIVEDGGHPMESCIEVNEIHSCIKFLLLITGDHVNSVNITEYGAYISLSPVIAVKLLAHSINFLIICFCGSVSIVEVTTKCFSSLLISGVGKFLYTVSFSAIRIILKFIYIVIQTHVKENPYLKLSSTLHLMR